MNAIILSQLWLHSILKRFIEILHILLIVEYNIDTLYYIALPTLFKKKSHFYYTEMLNYNNQSLF